MGEQCAEHSKLSETMDKLLAETQEIKAALLGTFENPNGMVQEISDLKKRVSELERYNAAQKNLIWKIVWKVGATAVAGGSVVGISINKILQLFN
jgi:regulator of replication initiation timing